MSERTVRRLYMLPSGAPSFIQVAVCKCGSRARGPLGGCCGNCGGGIMSADEQRDLNFRLWQEKHAIKAAPPAATDPERLSKAQEEG